MTTRVPPTRLVYPGTVLEHIGVVVVVVRTELCVVLIVEAVSCSSGVIRNKQPVVIHGTFNNELAIVCVPPRTGIHHQFHSQICQPVTGQVVQISIADPKFRVKRSEPFLIISPIPLKINRAIYSSLYYRPIMLAVMAECWDHSSCCQGNSTRAILSLEKKKTRELEKHNDKFRIFFGLRHLKQTLNYSKSGTRKTNIQST